MLVFSQGFDWQMPTRMPAKTSNLFIGGNINSSLYHEFADFSFYEADCNCGTFSDGSGLGLSGGIASEYWLKDGLQSVLFKLNFRTKETRFKAEHSLPVLLPDNSESRINYRNTLEQSAQYIDIRFGYKHRIMQSHFSIGLGANILLQISNKQKHYEDIIGPSWAAPFPTSPPSYRRQIDEGNIDDTYKIQFEPTLCFSYDFSLGIGIYATPYLQFGLPIFNISKEGINRPASIRIGFSILNWI